MNSQVNLPETLTLEIIAAEISREISETNQKQANSITRASIVLAAAGISLFVPFTMRPAPFISLSILLAALSASFALVAISYWKSRGTIYTKELVQAYSSATPEQVLEKLVSDLLTELNASVRDLGRKTKWARVSLWLLSASWLSYLLHGIFSLLNIGIIY